MIAHVKTEVDQEESHLPALDEHRLKEVCDACARSDQGDACANLSANVLDLFIHRRPLSSLVSDPMVDAQMDIRCDTNDNTGVTTAIEFARLGSNASCALRDALLTNVVDIDNDSNEGEDVIIVCEGSTRFVRKARDARSLSDGLSSSEDPCGLVYLPPQNALSGSSDGHMLAWVKTASQQLLFADASLVEGRRVFTSLQDNASTYRTMGLQTRPLFYVVSKGRGAGKLRNTPPIQIVKEEFSYAAPAVGAHVEARYCRRDSNYYPGVIAAGGPDSFTIHWDEDLSCSSKIPVAWIRRPAAQRLKPPITATGFLCGLPEKPMSTIAEFASPPGTYNLCMTANVYHQEVEGKEMVLATWLLRCSLMASLSSVLRRAGIDLAAVSFDALRSATGAPGALISGSTMVQAALGVDWQRTSRNVRALLDVDIFCTAHVAPAVRSQLMQNKFTFCGFGDSYSDTYGNSITAHLVESAIHHVEGYAKTPPKDDPDFDFDASCSYGEDVDHFCYYKSDSSGEHFGIDLFPWHRRQKSTSGLKGMQNRRKGDRANKGSIPAPYAIRTLPGHALSFDFNLESERKLDLVIAEPGCDDALELLESFDIIICKCSFDGTKFRIPEPHRTFKMKSSLEPKRRRLMRAFAKIQQSHSHSHSDPEATNSYGGDLPRAEVWEAVYGRYAKRQNSEEKCALAAIAQTQLLQKANLKPPSSMDMAIFHNFFARLFNRQKKYASRGIEIIGRSGILKLVEIDVVEIDD